MSSSPSPTASTRPLTSLSPKPGSRTINPISLRLYKVLGANFDDEATKDALGTLSDLYAYSTPSGSGSGAGKGDGRHKLWTREGKNDDELDISSDEEETTTKKKQPKQLPLQGSVLSDVSTVSSGTAARARKSLRRDVEVNLTKSSKKFLRALGEVDQKLDTLQTHVTNMRLQCDNAQTQLHSTNEACQTLLERAGNLREERQTLSTNQTLLTLFLERFTLTPQQTHILTSRDIKVGREFFDAMEKAEKVSKDARVLVGVEGPTKAGLDIIQVTTQTLNTAYQKLHSHLLIQFSHLSSSRAAIEGELPNLEFEFDWTTREAVRRLRARPELLSEALQSLTTHLSPTLHRTFLHSLSRSQLQLHAHDPLRYIGDVLAWVHQAVAEIREGLEALFGVGQERQREGRMIGSTRRREGEVEEWIGEVGDGAVSRLIGPLGIQVTQTVRSQQSPIPSYRIANLIQFYEITMGRTLGDTAVLSVALREMKDVAYKVFFDSIEAQGRALLRITLDLDDPTLTPPNTIIEHIQTLREILSVYASSKLDEEKDDKGGASEIRRILDVMIDPAVEMCVESAEEKRRLRLGWDKAVFVINCLTYLQGVLEPFAFTEEKRTTLDALVRERVNQLIEEHYNDILQDANLHEAALVCQTSSDEPLSSLPAMSPSALSTALHSFSLWLSGLEVVHSPRLARLTVQRLHLRVHQAALQKLAKTYQRLCEEVRKPENKYEAASTLLGSERPFGQVHLLRQIFGLGEEEEEA